MAIFGFNESVFFDSNFVKVIYGVAGRGKSSVLVKALSKTNFLWTTSTNKLARDAKARYDIETTTVCRGLFVNEFGQFYMEQKNPDKKTIVIDEILQTDERVFAWIENHVGAYNIFVLTDPAQMTTACGNNLVTLFNDLLTKPYVVADEGTTTLRARTQETKDKIEYLYTLPSDEATAFVDDLRAMLYPVIPYSDMPFNKDDIYICHTNKIEDYLYRDHKLTMDSYTVDELIPKGGIASNPPKHKVGNYPILSQLQAVAQKARSYYQLANVGSCTRYQGSECDNTRKLYYIINNTSVVTNREWYTVVSRCWDIKSIVIVVFDRVDNKEPLTTYRGKAIKQRRILSVTDAPVWANTAISNDVFDKLREDNEDPAYWWDPTKMYVDGKLYMRRGNMSEVSNKSSAKSLINKEPYFNHEYMEQVYKVLERFGDVGEVITYPRPKSNGSHNHEYLCEFDLEAAYPHVCKFAKLPVDGTLYTTYDKDKLNFYRYTGDALAKDCIITDVLAEYLGFVGCEYVFSTDYVVGSKMGAKLLDMAHKHKESKKECKDVHYGYWQKKYLSYDPLQDCYVRNGYKHELVMVAILSQMSKIVMQVRDVLGIDNGVFVADAYKWDDLTIDIGKLNEFMHDNYPEYDYRVFDRKKVVYQTYEELPCKKCYRQKDTEKRKKVCAGCTLQGSCKYGTILLQG